MVKFPSMEQWKSFFKKEWKMLGAGIVIGAVGAVLYMKTMTRAALVDITGRASGLESIGIITPETKTYVAFISLGIFMALILSAAMDKRKK